MQDSVGATPCLRTDHRPFQDPRQWYAEYLRSSAWRSCPARLDELRLSEGRCRLCGRGGDEIRIEIHHRTYANLGYERAADLCTLCVDCHDMVTSELRRRRFEATALPRCDDTPRAVANPQPSDLVWEVPND